MVRTQQTASLQLSRTPWTRRRKRKIWRAKRIKAELSSTGCSEPWLKKLRQPCEDGYCWKEQHINWRIPDCRSRTSPSTPTTVRWRRSLALSEKLFGLLPASAGAQQNSLFSPWFVNKRRKRHGSIRSFCRQRLLAHAAFVGIRGYLDRRAIGSAAAQGHRDAALAGVE